MALKKKQRSEESSFRDQKFVSEKAKERFEEANQKERGFIQERGIDFGDMMVTGITDVIQDFKWQTFILTPTFIIAPIVMEFYANVMESANGKVRVRGKEVKFDAATINAYYELPHIDDVEDEHEYYLWNVNHNRVIQELTTGGAQWVMANGSHKKFVAGRLHSKARIWQYFVNTRLMPTTHNSTVDRVRAILLYAILTKKKMNIGHIIVS